MGGLSLEESLARGNDEILVAVMLDHDNPLDSYVRPGTPLPSEAAVKDMITKVQILMSMVKSTKGYLGDFEHVSVRHKLGVVYLFPAGPHRVLCVVARPEPDGRVAEAARQFLDRLG